MKQLSRPHVFRPEDSAICVVDSDGNETAVLAVEDLAYVDILCDLPRIKRFLEGYTDTVEGTISAASATFNPAMARELLRRMP